MIKGGVRFGKMEISSIALKHMGRDAKLTAYRGTEPKWTALSRAGDWLLQAGSRTKSRLGVKRSTDGHLDKHFIHKPHGLTYIIYMILLLCAVFSKTEFYALVKPFVMFFLLPSVEPTDVSCSP